MKRVTSSTAMLAILLASFGCIGQPSKEELLRAYETEQGKLDELESERQAEVDEMEQKIAELEAAYQEAKDGYPQSKSAPGSAIIERGRPAPRNLLFESAAEMADDSYLVKNATDKAIAETRQLYEGILEDYDRRIALQQQKVAAAEKLIDKVTP